MSVLACCQALLLLLGGTSTATVAAGAENVLWFAEGSGASAIAALLRVVRNYLSLRNHLHSVALPTDQIPTLAEPRDIFSFLVNFITYE